MKSHHGNLMKGWHEDCYYEMTHERDGIQYLSIVFHILKRITYMLNIVERSKYCINSFEKRKIKKGPVKKMTTKKTVPSL